MGRRERDARGSGVMREYDAPTEEWSSAGEPGCVEEDEEATSDVLDEPAFPLASGRSATGLAVDTRHHVLHRETRAGYGVDGLFGSLVRFDAPAVEEDIVVAGDDEPTT